MRFPAVLAILAFLGLSWVPVGAQGLGLSVGSSASVPSLSGRWRGEGGILVIVAPASGGLSLAFSWDPSAMAVEGLRLTGGDRISLHPAPAGVDRWTGEVVATKLGKGQGPTERHISYALARNDLGVLTFTVTASDGGLFRSREPRTVALTPIGAVHQAGADGLPRGLYALEGSRAAVSLTTEGGWLTMASTGGGLEVLMGALGFPAPTLAPGAVAGEWDGTLVDPQGRGHALRVALEADDLVLRVGTWPLSVTRRFHRL